MYLNAWQIITMIFQSIACELINTDGTERLERIFVILTNIHGRVNNLYGIAFVSNACKEI